jgi:hypothetical protein
MSKKPSDKNFKTAVIWTFIAILIFMTIIALKIYTKDMDGFKISELSKGTDYQICTSSIEAPFLYCNNYEGDEGFQIDRTTTQEQLNEWIKKCPNTIILKGNICIGHYLTIVGENRRQ